MSKSVDSTARAWVLHQKVRGRKEASLLDGKLLCVAWELTPRLVDSAIGTAGDKADDLVTVEDPDFASVRGHIFFGDVLPVSVRQRLSCSGSGSSG